MRAVRSVQDGESPEDVARTLRVGPRAMYRWLALYRRGGWNALKAKPLAGPPKLDGGTLDWYNQQHHHAGIGLMTPDQVHYGQTDAIHAARQNTLDHAFRNNPERFVNKAPTPPDKPTAAWINPPASTLKIQA
jgi:transposase-like protein